MGEDLPLKRNNIRQVRTKFSGVWVVFSLSFLSIFVFEQKFVDRGGGEGLYATCLLLLSVFDFA